MTERYVFCPRCDEACRRLEFVYVGEGSIVTRRKAHAEAVILKHRPCDEYVVQVYRAGLTTGTAYAADTKLEVGKVVFNRGYEVVEDRRWPMQ